MKCDNSYVIVVGVTQFKFLRYYTITSQISQIRRVPRDTKAVRECFDIPELAGTETKEGFLTVLAEGMEAKWDEMRKS
ncbi:MAG: hypothetical protein QXW73_07430 [Nitrososphaerales archaeon]